MVSQCFPSWETLHQKTTTEEPVSLSTMAALLSGAGTGENASVVISDLHAALYVKDVRVFWYNASLDFFTQTQSKFTIYVTPSSNVMLVSSLFDNLHLTDLWTRAFRWLSTGTHPNSVDLS
jgi:hypothetical protein